MSCPGLSGQLISELRPHAAQSLKSAVGSFWHDAWFAERSCRLHSGVYVVSSGSRRKLRADDGAGQASDTGHNKPSKPRQPPRGEVWLVPGNEWKQSELSHSLKLGQFLQKRKEKRGTFSFHHYHHEMIF